MEETWRPPRRWKSVVGGLLRRADDGQCKGLTVRLLRRLRRILLLSPVGPALAHPPVYRDVVGN